MSQSDEQELRDRADRRGEDHRFGEDEGMMPSGEHSQRARTSCARGVHWHVYEDKAASTLRCEICGRSWNIMPNTPGWSSAL